MDNKELLKAAAELGFPLLEAEESDLNNVLAEVVKSRNVRLWEGFPVLLRNVWELGNLDDNRVLALLDQEAQENFQSLKSLSVAVYEYFSLSGDLGNGGTQPQGDFQQDVLKWRDLVANGGTVSVGKVSLSLERMKRLFQDYYLSARADTEKKKLAAQEGAGLEYAMSQVLSPKQKELFRKKLDGKPLTKTEKEYFSRVVKKKILALANDELHRLAKLV